jgi:CzcA family heavy metal efflux pump
MMRWIVSSSLKFRLLVIPIAAALMIIGFVRLRDAPVDVLPEFSPPTVQIQTEALGLSAAEVEQFITVPMEQDLLNGVPWLKEIRSESLSGLSSINLVFNSGTDILQARQMVQERMTQAVALPHVSKPPVMIQPVSSTSRVMVISLSAKDVSLIDMSVLARWRIKPRLMGIPGVANVSTWGQRERQLQVQVDPEQLAKQNVSLTQVITTTGNALWVSPLTFVEASTPGTGGFIDTPNQRLSIQHVLPIKTAQDLAQVRVEETTDKPLRLGDVAQVVEDHQPLIGDAVVDGGRGLVLVVEKFPGANTLEVTRQVEDALTALGPGLTGIKVDTTVYRPATFIEQATRHLTTVLIISVLLLMLLFLVVLLDWRTALVSLVTIALSMLAAALVLYIRGATLNTVMLAGLVLALGAVVDDVVVQIANIRRRLREDGPSVAEAVVDASLQVRRPLLYATLVLLVAAAPFLFLPGVAGSFARVMAISFMIALVASTMVALVVTPVLALLVFSRAARDRRDPFLVRWTDRHLAGGVSRVSGRPRVVLAAATVVGVAALAVLPLLGGAAMFPALQDRNLLVGITGTPGTSEPEMVRIADQAAAALRAVPGVRNVGAHVGRAMTSDQVVELNSGQIWITLDPSADYRRTTDRIKTVIARYPALAHNLVTYPEQRIKSATTGAQDDVIVRVYGQDLDVLRSKSEEVRKVLAGISGVVAPKIDLPAEEPVVEIEVNLQAAQRVGIRPGDVRRETAILLSGLQAGSLFEDQKVFDVVVWSTPASRSNVTAIEQLMIDTPDGGHVRLKDVATVSVKPNVAVIKHDAVSRRVEVTAAVHGRSVSAVNAEVQRKLRSVAFPLEYHAEVIGVSAKRAADRNLAIGLGLTALVLILLLFQAGFGKWRLAAALVVTLPLALAGGLLAALVTGVGLSLGSLAGLGLVCCLAVRNGALSIASYQRIERDEDPAPDGGPGLLARGAQERGVPILVTALAVGLALVPMVVFGSVPGSELLYPLAVTALGGLLTATLFSLLVVPAVYLLFGADREPRPDRESAQHPEASEDRDALRDHDREDREGGELVSSSPAG